MAADSLVTSNGGGGVPFRVEKVTRIGGSLFGFAGSLAAGLRFVEWIKAGKPEESRDSTLDEGTEIVELDKTGIYLWDSSMIRIAACVEHYAIGSGCQYAMAALELGHTPDEAVTLAAKFDASTGGTITYQPLEATHGNEAVRKRRKATDSRRT
jgi:ATP-dependent protease HslVU (ClpYQ) peptidase subunit